LQNENHAGPEASSGRTSTLAWGLMRDFEATGPVAWKNCGPRAVGPLKPAFGLSGQVGL